MANNCAPATFHCTINGDEDAPLLSNKNNGYFDISCDGEDNIHYQSINSIGSACSINGKDLTHDSHFLTASSRTVVSHHSLLHTLIEKISDDNGTTLFLTISSIMPVLQGSSVFGLPYAFLTGGLSFLLAAIFICILAEISSCLLIDCLYEVSPRSQRKKRVYTGFTDLSLACWGSFGSKVVNVSNFIYYLMNNVVNVVLLGQCMYNLLNGHVSLSNREIAMVFSVILIPLIFIRKISVLAYMGFVGTVSVIVACITSFVIFIQHSHVWLSNYHSISIFNYEQYPLAIGILLYTLMIAPSLPEIEGTMTDRSQIGTALHISFGFSSIFKMVFGVLGVLTFGIYTKQLVATNISMVSAPAEYIISIMLALYAISNTTFYCYIINEMLDRFMVYMVSTKFEQGQRYNIPWMIFSRIIGIVLIVCIGLVMPFFALVSGVVGAVCGSFTALITPVLFHLQLKWKELSILKRISEIILLVVSCLLGIFATYSSLDALIKAVKNHHGI